MIKKCKYCKYNLDDPDDAHICDPCVDSDDCCGFEPQEKEIKLCPKCNSTLREVSPLGMHSVLECISCYHTFTPLALDMIEEQKNLIGEMQANCLECQEIHKNRVQELEVMKNDSASKT